MRLIDADALTEWIIRELRAMPNGVFNMLNGRQAANLIGNAIDEAPTVAMSENNITLSWTPDADVWFKEVAERALDEFEYKGRTIRAWVELIMGLPEPPKEVTEYDQDDF